MSPTKQNEPQKVAPLNGSNPHQSTNYREGYKNYGTTH